ncbi:hypothetical protein WJX72_004174 [[Myrmecia] bisecta]|uniref:Uncharacterized protein n=1 Tax=[Myrmecia] bisecta TaxID=41462 RepID=A0AAW1NY58_9CHLO
MASEESDETDEASDADSSADSSASVDMVLAGKWGFLAKTLTVLTMIRFVEVEVEHIKELAEQRAQGILVPDSESESDEADAATCRKELLATQDQRSEDTNVTNGAGLGQLHVQVERLTREVTEQQRHRVELESRLQWAQEQLQREAQLRERAEAFLHSRKQASIAQELQLRMVVEEGLQQHMELAALRKASTAEAQEMDTTKKQLATSLRQARGVVQHAMATLAGVKNGANGGADPSSQMEAYYWAQIAALQAELWQARLELSERVRSLERQIAGWKRKAGASQAVLAMAGRIAARSCLEVNRTSSKLDHVMDSLYACKLVGIHLTGDLQRHRSEYLADPRTSPTHMSNSKRARHVVDEQMLTGKYGKAAGKACFVSRLPAGFDPELRSKSSMF